MRGLSKIRPIFIYFRRRHELSGRYDYMTEFSDFQSSRFQRVVDVPPSEIAQIVCRGFRKLQDENPCESFIGEVWMSGIPRPSFNRVHT